MNKSCPPPVLESNTIVIVVLLLVVSTTPLVHAQQQIVCVLAPIDQTINSINLVMAFNMIAQHNQTAKYVGLIPELTNKTSATTGCDVVLQFQRMNNVNTIWDAKNIHYKISGNTITLFTNTTPVVLNTGASGGVTSGISGSGQSGSVFALPMTNAACLGLAFGSYHQSLGYTGSTYCDPYLASSTDHNPNHDVPSYIVQKSLEHAFAKLHL